ncbi:MAG TPA: protein kinase [Vicinamibacterales bacterium]|nr:protein kinase [Vicinamibacterales bacterium]
MFSTPVESAGESLIGRQLHQYLVTDLLGHGGMGMVYRAHDVRLERDVALKVLPPGQLGDDARRQRFLREARAASALSHANIVTIYEIDSDEDVDFIAMELVHGRSLAESLPPGGLNLDRITAYAVQLLEGMSVAHRAGLVHRDLKPGNVMIRDDGALKILDFGLAKLRAAEYAETEQALTAEGLVMGTIAYMSPEQARGDPVGPSSDVFSLGVILYEMVSGRRPFRGSGLSAVHALLEGRFDPVLQLRPDCPPWLERVITRALQPDPLARYASASAMLDDVRGALGQPSSGGLARIAEASSDAADVTVIRPAPARSARREPAIRRWWWAAVVISIAVAAAFLYRDRYAGAAIESLAILPFANESGVPDLDYIAVGLPDSVHRDFSGAPGLRVPLRGSIRGWDPVQRDFRSAATESGVDAVFTGRLEQVNGRLQADVELVDREGTVLWRHRYENPGGLLDLQQRISSDLAEQIGITPVRRKPPANAGAYELYVKGRYEVGLRTMDNLRRAILYFSQATSIDREFAAAYAGIGEAYALIANFGSQPPVTALEQAKTAARRALELDPTIAEAHTAYGFAVVFSEHDWAQAEKSFRRAIELNPNLAEPHAYLSIVVLTPLKRFDEAMIEIQRAIDLEPASEIRKLVQVHVLYMARHYEKALALLDEVAPGFLPVEIALERSFNLAGLGRHAEAAAAILDVVPEAKLWADHPEALDQSQLTVLGSLGRLHAQMGDTTIASRIADQLERAAARSYVSGCVIAAIHIELSRSDAAMRELTRCVAERDFQSLHLGVDARFDAVRDDPRFSALVQSLGLAIP